jgi:hypothetical protein
VVCTHKTLGASAGGKAEHRVVVLFKPWRDVRVLVAEEEERQHHGKRERC